MIYNTDIVVIGGGINGCGIAAEAAERGLSVTLIERSDLAAYTSSSSSKLIHGGLRYLENKEFALVRESLKERTVLQSIAPNLVKPQRFFLPLTNTRNSWIIRLGLFLYDNLSKIRADERSTYKILDKSILDHKFNEGFEYSDCTTDDSRLVIANAVKARNNGANILTYTTIHSIDKLKDKWKLTVSGNGIISTITCDHIINATGPWVNDVHYLIYQDTTLPFMSISHVKGSHIIVPSIHKSMAYTFQLPDKRVIFAIPYLNNTTLIGTTEKAVTLKDKNSWKVTEDEVDYLITNINSFLHPTKQIDKQTIISTFAGVRPLIAEDKEATNTSRDYKICVDNDNKVTTIYGGKITTYRKLAKEVIDSLTTIPSISHLTKLPGNSYFPSIIFESISPEILERWKQTYGSNTQKVIDMYHPTHRIYNQILSETEILYLMRYEFAKKADDILYCRTKLGYFFTFSDQSKQEIQSFMDYHR